MAELKKNKIFLEFSPQLGVGKKSEKISGICNVLNDARVRQGIIYEAQRHRFLDFTNAHTHLHDTVKRVLSGVPKIDNLLNDTVTVDDGVQKPSQVDLRGDEMQTIPQNV